MIYLFSLPEASSSCLISDGYTFTGNPPLQEHTQEVICEILKSLLEVHWVQPGGTVLGYRSSSSVLLGYKKNCFTLIQITIQKVVFGVQGWRSSFSHLLSSSVFASSNTAYL